MACTSKAWKDGSYKGLRARGAFTIDTNWKNGMPTVIQVTSDRGNDVKVKKSDVQYIVYCDKSRYRIHRCHLRRMAIRFHLKRKRVKSIKLSLCLVSI
ncbi:glycoside hydrolase family 95-like protein [Bacillus pacificus]